MPRNDPSVEYVSERLAYYRKEKRLRGFLLHKSQNSFKKMKKAVRLLSLGKLPSPDILADIKVRIRLDSHKKLKRFFV